MRESMSVVPDRKGHAASDPTSTGNGTASNAVVANPKTEMYITLGAQDTLSSVAKAYGVTLEWLIRRNRLTKSAQAGDNLIVPKAR